MGMILVMELCHARNETRTLQVKCPLPLPTMTVGRRTRPYRLLSCVDDDDCIGWTSEVQFSWENGQDRNPTGIVGHDYPEQPDLRGGATNTQLCADTEGARND